MKKSGNFSAALFAAALVLCSCNNGAQEKPATGKAEAAPAVVEGQMNIAYVEVDSIMTKYNFCIESKEALEKKLQNIQSTLAKKEKELNNAAMQFEQNLRSNKFTSEKEAMGVKAGIEKQAADLQNLRDNLMTSYAKEEEKLNKKLQEDIDNFIKEYNKDGKYTYIVSKIGNNIMYGAPQLNITEDVINGLNKAHSSKKK